MQKRNGAYFFQVQTIHYVILVYAIKCHTVQRNVLNVYTFDERYRRLEKSKTLTSPRTGERWGDYPRILGSG